MDIMKKAKLPKKLWQIKNITFTSSVTSKINKKAYVKIYNIKNVASV